MSGTARGTRISLVSSSITQIECVTCFFLTCFFFFLKQFQRRRYLSFRSFASKKIAQKRKKRGKPRCLIRGPLGTPELSFVSAQFTTRLFHSCRNNRFKNCWLERKYIFLSQAPNKSLAHAYTYPSPWKWMAKSRVVLRIFGICLARNSQTYVICKRHALKTSQQSGTISFHDHQFWEQDVGLNYWGVLCIPIWLCHETCFYLCTLKAQRALQKGVGCGNIIGAAGMHNNKREISLHNKTCSCRDHCRPAGHSRRFLFLVWRLRQAEHDTSQQC